VPHTDPAPLRVLITAKRFCDTPGPHHTLLDEAGFKVVFHPTAKALSAAQLAEAAAGFHGCILGLDIVDDHVLDVASELRIVSRFGVGFDTVDLDAARERGVAVTNTPGANATAVAELALGLLFSLARELPQAHLETREGGWNQRIGWELGGKTLGVIGMGAIGRELAPRAQALGLRVLAYDPYVEALPDGVLACDLDTLLAESDAVSLHAALTPETQHLLNGERLARMKRSAVLINTARGALVDQVALHAALIEGQLAAAALDAFEIEPPVGSPLLSLDNVILSPHAASSTLEATLNMALAAAENVRDVLLDRPCHNRVA
jgi:D-3-phosphoglycerate dehydrogenase